MITTTLQVGSAQVDITPSVGTQIAGDIGRYRPAAFVLDPLYARAIVFEQAGKMHALLCLDVMTLTDRYTKLLREQITQRFGIEPASIMAHTIQNHSGPSVGFFTVDDQPQGTVFENCPAWLQGADADYSQWAIDRAADAVGEAIENIEPCWMSFASGMVEDIACNRRLVMRDGTSQGPGPRRLPHSEALYPEGPVDPEVGVAAFVTRSLKTKAMLLHYTCHPTYGYPRHFISADWCGAWAAAAMRKFDVRGTAMVINGCCGNIMPGSMMQLQPKKPPLEQTADKLMAAAQPAIESFTLEPAGIIDCRSRRIDIELRHVPEDELAAARELLAKHPDPQWTDETRTSTTWDWVYAACRVALADRTKRQTHYSYEIQALRLGELAILALTGEPFVQAQLEIKIRSPFRRTFPAHMSNGYVGYIPTEEGFERGGFETWTGQWSKLCKAAHRQIIEASVELLEELHGNAST